MNAYQNWKYNEYQQVGKDYSQPKEVEDYDSSHAQFRDVETENATLIAMLNLCSDSSVLDIGCGTGEFALASAKVSNSVLGIDVSPEMLKRANEKRRGANLVNLDFAYAGYLDFEVPDESLDVVTSSFSLHHLPDFWKGVALSRIWRSLKHEGVLFLRDVVMPDEEAIGCVNVFIGRQDERGGEFLRDDAIGHFREEFSTYSWVMLGLLERSGFSVELEEVKDGVLVEYLCRKRGACLD
ncbi:class I SAM-dependent methyltransferase [Pelagicoccus sp. SDUM812002]|uniref:class I SAM-dependent methyltransferase n=1 Tax=Pelagicoccus sp. SDUM812002 TaxID=3041266 RepID=UPI0028100D7A|nr:class I SAM-dependent methyltransferase [Pelagicoccus sp. SDUM812002]MDQ8185318.1 class I SAM-dependent methyltransferase [Pelagicoccus sp. SDUM812002]